MEASEERRGLPRRPPPPNLARPPVLSHVESIASFHDLQKVHDTAHSFVNSGLEADERNDAHDALRYYTEGLRLIDKGLRIDCELLASNSGDQTDQAKLMQQKMTKTKQQITFRLQSLQTELQNDNTIQARMEADGPPSYEDAMREQPASSYMDDEMMALGDSIFNGELESGQVMTNASDLFTIEDGVQIFYISPNGLVSAPSYPSSLHVVRMPEHDQAMSSRQDNQNPPAFLHVNDWMYPLVPGSSPALETHYGAYIFPDLMAQQTGSAVGLILPDSVPPQTRQKFEQVIRSFTLYQTQTAEALSSPEERQLEVERDQDETTQIRPESVDTSTKISQGIVVAADWIAWGLNKGAEKAGSLIRIGSEKIREKTRPSMEAHKVDPKIKKGLVYARKATHVSVQVTGYLVSKLGEATSALAREIAPHLREKGEKILPSSVKKTDVSGKSKLDGVVEVAASGLKGFGTIYISLETAAKTLGRNLANETVSIVHHKYGAEAGHVTEDTVYAAGNVAMTAFNANNFGIKAVAKRAAKDTGKAMLEDMNKNKTDNRGYVSCEDSDSSNNFGNRGAEAKSRASYGVVQSKGKQ